MKSARADSERFCFLRKFENQGILYVFPIFQTALREQKIRCSAVDDLFRGSLASPGRSILFLYRYAPSTPQEAGPRKEPVSCIGAARFSEDAPEPTPG